MGAPVVAPVEKIPVPVIETAAVVLATTVICWPAVTPDVGKPILPVAVTTIILLTSEDVAV